MAPTTTDQYTIEFASGLDGLQLHRDVPIPALGPHDCLVEIEAISLNYRDIAMVKKLYPAAIKSNVVPTSDASGTVLAVGKEVQEFKVGDKVCNTFFQAFESGPLTAEARETTLGGLIDGPLTKHGVFLDTALVLAPSGLTAEQSSTLPCAALTAWKALFGLEGKTLKAGECVLTQGTGGVSIFAVQLGLAVGATVIATTSSESKAKKLRDMGVQHVINYREDENWGETAKKLSPGGLGAHHILEVGGVGTLEQSFKAVKLEGVISMIGFLAGMTQGDNVSFWNTFITSSVIRGIAVGSREQFKAMNKFIDEKQIKPVVDEKVFEFEDAKAAYNSLEAQKFFGKVVIKAK